MVIFKTYGQKWPFQEMEGFWLVLNIIQRWNKDQDNVPYGHPGYRGAAQHIGLRP